MIAAAARDFPGGKTLILSTKGLRAFARNEGLFPVSVSHWREADLVLLCRDTEISYGRLESAANAVRAGIPLYCANPDLVHPGNEGIHLETGSILALFRAIHPELRARVFGKPDPALLFEALAFLKLGSEECLFIGDSLETDASCARAAGVPFIHVGGTQGFPLSGFVSARLK
jgi:ribonucleotide monophosphatase NagD (HAD superfamily)